MVVVDKLFKLFQVYIDAIKAFCNCYNKAYNIINIKWENNVIMYMETKDYFKRTFKLITSIARRTNIFNYDTILLFVNSQAIRYFKENKN